MSSKLGYHIQAARYPDWLKEHVARSGAKFVKIINPHEGEAQPFGPGITYIGRLWWEGEPDLEMVKQGAAGADTWFAMAWLRMRRAPWCKVWEGPNEPAIQTTEQAHALASFERRRIELVHGARLEAASYCFGTGNPPYLSLWRILAGGIHTTDYLALHEYGMRRMDLDGWHLLRYRKVIAKLRWHGYHVPPIIISETGIDYSGHPINDGWRAQGINEAEYLAQLAAYDQELQKDPEVVAALPFTWNHQGWPSFRIDGAMAAMLAEYMAIQNAGAPDADIPLPASVEARILADALPTAIPWHSGHAFPKYVKGRGWQLRGPEYDVTIDGVDHRYQVFATAEGELRVVYAVKGDWGNVQHAEAGN